MEQRYKRINFRINQYLYEMLDNASKKAGVSKANLVREWLDNHNGALYLKGFDWRDKGKTTFNLRVPQYLDSQMKKYSRTSGLSLSDLIRIVITNNLTRSI